MLATERLEHAAHLAAVHSNVDRGHDVELSVETASVPVDLAATGCRGGALPVDAPRARGGVGAVVQRPQCDLPYSFFNAVTLSSAHRGLSSVESLCIDNNLTTIHGGAIVPSHKGRNGERRGR